MNITVKALLKSFFVNLFLSVSKVIAGIFGKSSALIADGIHSFSDLMTDGVAIFGDRYALKPADKEHPFGHGKVEYLTCLVIGAVVLALGLEVIFSAYQENIIIPNRLVIWVSLFTIFLKFLISRYLLKVGYKQNSEILISSGKESSTDVISSVFVLLSGILMQFTDTYPMLKYSNFIATIIVGILIVHTGFYVIKENVSFIIGKQEDNNKLEAMIDLIAHEEKVDQVDNLAVIKNGPYFQITGEVSMDENLSLKEVHSIVENLEQKLRDLDERAKYITIHVNPTQK